MDSNTANCNTLHFYHKEVSTHEVRCYHSFLVELLLKVWIWYRCQNRKLITMVENNWVLIKKISIKTQSKKLYITRNCTQETSNDIFNRMIVKILGSNDRDWTGKLQVILLSAERICICTLFLRKWKQMWERKCVKEFFFVNVQAGI